MTLVYDWDVADQWVSAPGFALTQEEMSGGTLSDCWVLPGNLGLMLQPLQMTPSWAAATGKWQITDWILDTNRWEQVSHRAPGDWFLQSRGLADTAAVTKRTAIPRNAGLFIEFFAFSLPHVLVRDLLILTFSGGLRLHVHSDGTADIEDTRANAPAAYLLEAAELAPAGLGSRFVQIAITPWQRGHLLVSCNLGGWFSCVIGETLDPSSANKAAWSPGEVGYHVSLESAAPSVQVSPLCRAFFALSTLRYPDSGSWQSPAVALPRAVTAAPDTLGVRAEQQDSTRATVQIFAPGGGVFAPTAIAPRTAAQLQIVLTSPGSDFSPYVRSVAAAYITQTQTRGGAPVRLPGPIRADLHMNHVLGSVSLTMLLDNSRGAVTALKDLHNRRLRVSWVPDGVVDSDAGVLFDGYTDSAEFHDGAGSVISLRCSGLRKRLRTHLLPPGLVFDGLLHTDCVRMVLENAGVPATDFVIAADDGVTLSAAVPGQQPRWETGVGVSADRFIVQLCDLVSGWAFSESAGKLVYAPQSAFLPADLSTLPHLVPGTPAIAAANTVVLMSLLESEEEPRANDITVIGMSDTGTEVRAHYVDWDGISNSLSPNYVSARREFVYRSAAIATAAEAAVVLGVLAARLSNRRQYLRVRAVGMSIDRLPLLGTVQVDGYGIARLISCGLDLSADRARASEFVLELL